MDDILMINPIAGTRLKNSSSYPGKSSTRKATRANLEPDTVTLSSEAGAFAEQGEEDEEEAASSY